MEEPTKVVGRRVVGFILDSLIYSAIVAGLWFALTDRLDASTSGGGGFKIGDTRYGFTEANAGNRTIFLIVVVVIAILYFIVIPGLRGKTPGKWITGITIVRDAGGTAPGIWRQFVRELLWFVDSLPVLNLVAFFTCLLTKNHQRVGDLVARTYVVRDGSLGALAAAPATSAAPAPPPPST